MDSASGRYTYAGKVYELTDLPGTYSLMARSAEEEVARDHLCQDHPQAVIVVCDATCMERSLHLVAQVLAITRRVVLCVNLADEAEKRGLCVDGASLQAQLGVPVVITAARQRRGLERLKKQVAQMAQREQVPPPAAPYAQEVATEELQTDAEAVVRTAWAQRVAAQCVTGCEEDVRSRRWDAVLTSRWAGIPLMLLLLAAVLWITIAGANVPSQWLSGLLFGFQDQLSAWMLGWGAPAWLHGALVLGMYRVLAWVVSVMLPPMAIFFPLFTLLEDAGYLPRVAFNLDSVFQRCRACGKQALTTCMGLGCNAVGVTGCRIIDSPRERMIAMLTNSFVPCNGRFPTLIALMTLFFVGQGAGSAAGAAFGMTALLVFSVGMSCGVSRLLSATVLRGMPSSFVMELPPYRMPQVGRVLIRSVLDRTLFVLGRAAMVAAPAGLVIWILANVPVGGSTCLVWLAQWLQPLGWLMGMDGVILLAFLLALPANEIVMPLILMGYLSTGTLTEANGAQLLQILQAHGWTWMTALCVMLFSLMHWPCSTTLLTIHKETGSWKWTTVAALIPTVCGVVICTVVAAACRTLFL